MKFGWDYLTDLMPPRLVLRRNATVMPVPREHKVGIEDWYGSGVYLHDGKPDPWLLRHMQKDDRLPEGEAETLPTETGEALFCGMMHGLFGHFLVESLGRFWAIDRLGPDIPLVFLSNKAPARNLGPTAREFMALTGVANPIREVRQPVRFDSLWNASCLFDPMVNVPLHPHLRRWLLERTPAQMQGFGPRIYVSRSGLGLKYGRILGEATIETALAAEGYVTFRPEQHSLAEQIAAYRQADQIILSESSAIHLMTMYCRPGTRVAMIRRRPDAPREINVITRCFPSRYLTFVPAITEIWTRMIPAPDWYSAVARIDLDYLWTHLRRHGLIGPTSVAPVADDAAIAAELAMLTEERTARVELQPGVRYLLEKKARQFGRE